MFTKRARRRTLGKIGAKLFWAEVRGFRRRCGWCGAEAGNRCHNWYGRPKQMCPERSWLVPATDDAAKPTFTQKELFHA